MLPGTAGATVLTATASTLAARFAAAKPGDTIRLSGTFGRTWLSNRSFAGTLTIDARAATFTDTLGFTNVGGITVLGGHYGNAASTSGVGIRVTGSTRVIISAPIVIGNASTSHGVDIASSSNVTVQNGSFTGLKLGVGFTAVTDGRIIGNKSIRSSSDGFDVADSHNVLVSRNSCAGTSIVAGAHPDCVQLWSVKGHAPQSDIEISDNTATGATQGFTSFNPDDGGGIRISILRNRVDTSYPQGVACYACIDSVFTGNILTTPAGSRYRTTINIIGGSGNTVSGNSIGPLVTTKSLVDPVDPPTSAFLTIDAVAAVPMGLTELADAGVAVGPEILLDGPAAAAAVPEPGVWALLLGGFAATGIAVRRRRRLAA